MESGEPTVEERVKAGAKLLDRIEPMWPALVMLGGPLTGYEMGRTYGARGRCGCVIGRTFGGFSEGMKELEKLTGEDLSPGDLGFINVREGYEVEYAELAGVWSREVSIRLEAGE